MNVLQKVTLQELKKNKTRTIVTIIGVILSVAMITAITTFISSMQNYLIEHTKKSEGSWHVTFSDVNSSFVNKLASNDEVKDYALTQNLGYSSLTNSKNEDKPYLYVSAFADETFQTLPISLLEGHLPQSDKELVISEHIQTNGGVTYKIGDTLTLEIGDRISEGAKLTQHNPYFKPEEETTETETLVKSYTKTYTVVGIFERPNFEPYSAPGYTVITKLDKANLQSSASLDMLVTLKKPSHIYNFSDTVKEDYSCTYNSSLLRYLGVSDNDNFNNILYSLAGILISLIMIGSVLLIYNSFSISVSERTRQFGILSSIGATKKQLLRSILFEGFFIGFIGIPLGVISGIFGIGVTLFFVRRIFDEMLTSGVSLSLSVSFISILAAVVVGIITIFISAYIPARRASRISAIDAIRQTNDIKINPKKVRTSKLVQTLFKLEGTLALKHFKRNKKRYRSTVLSLFVSVVLFISASSFGMFLKQGSETSVENYGYDVSFSTEDMTEKEAYSLYDKLKRASEVTNSALSQYMYFTADLPTNKISDAYMKFLERTERISSEYTAYTTEVYAIVVDDDTFSQYIKKLGFHLNDYINPQNPKLIASARIQQYDPKTQRALSFDLLKDKDPLELTVIDASDDAPEIKTHITITDFTAFMPECISQSNLPGLMIFVPNSMKQIFKLQEFKLIDDYESSITFTFQTNNPKKTTEEMKKIIKLEGKDSGRLFNVAEMLEANRNLLLVINIFSYGFIILISLITIANVFNTISTSIHLRRREFAMLKSIGMTEKGFQKMMRFECIFYGIKALLYGLPVSFVISYYTYRSLMIGMDLPFTLPWLHVGISIFSVFFIVFVTMLYSMRKLRKENTIDALKSDVL